MSYWEHERPVHRTRAISTANLAAATAKLLDFGGTGAVTVRAVARELGVAPASLYSRITAADDLFDIALDATLGEDMNIRLAERGVTLEELMIAYYRHLVQHPWASRVIAMRAPRGPNYLALSERMVVLLEQGGHADPLTAAYALSNFVTGSASTTPMAGSERVAAVPAELAPRYAALHATQHLDPERIFLTGLRALLVTSSDTGGASLDRAQRA
ncbi:TetR/AcrR family transcriptional regulator [Leucobacter luti]|uniref:TetR/AcrR family transcriptional regulator n=1 Tax=Leucobacter luti TaxID=340320 RepID=UPI00215D7FC2|nr:TetR/AcrR family transcriptional regulator [Leucobacter luti]